MPTHPLPPANQLSEIASSGVYWLPASAMTALRRATSDADLYWMSADLTGVASKQELLAQLAQACHFPAYFGHNWDALADALADLGWLPAATSYVLSLVHSQSLALHAGDELHIALDILRQVAAEWQGRNIAFHVLLDTPVSGLPPYPDSSCQPLPEGTGQQA